MSEYQVGDTVNITIKNAYVKLPDSPCPAYIVDGRMVNLPTYLPSVTVELVSRATPAEWLPRQKDLWRDRTGELWFATDVSHPDLTDQPDIKLVPSYDADGYDPEEVRADWSPLTLVHREEDER